MTKKKVVITPQAESLIKAMAETLNSSNVDTLKARLDKTENVVKARKAAYNTASDTIKNQAMTMALQARHANNGDKIPSKSYVDIIGGANGKKVSGWISRVNKVYDYGLNKKPYYVDNQELNVPFKGLLDGSETASISTLYNNITAYEKQRDVEQAEQNAIKTQAVMNMQAESQSYDGLSVENILSTVETLVQAGQTDNAIVQDFQAGLEAANAMVEQRQAQAAVQADIDAANDFLAILTRLDSANLEITDSAILAVYDHIVSLSDARDAEIAQAA